VAHIYNPSYLGGKEQEHHGSKPAWANSSRKSILKVPNIKKGWWSKREAKFNPSTLTKKKKKIKKITVNHPDEYNWQNSLRGYGKKGQYASYKESKKETNIIHKVKGSHG
jgi:hypothetical protein